MEPKIKRTGLAATASSLVILTGLLWSPAIGEQASSEFRRLPAGFLDAGDAHTCAILDTGQVRCWGYGSSGRLGYGNTADIGDNEAPGSVGPVDLGAGRTALAMSVGFAHTCAILDTGQVRCWGAGTAGRLGYGNTDDIGDNETAGSVGPVDLGAGRTAVAIAAGNLHNCAILDTGQVRCWGEGSSGQLGYGSSDTIGDNETPGSVGPVDLGAGRTGVAISAGGAHTCAILDTGQVRCWGEGGFGRLGYGGTDTIGDNETPGSVGPVDLGAGRTAVAISAGSAHTCAILDTGPVRCWGYGGFGQLGYGNTDDIGNDETPGSVGPVDLGAGRTAAAIAAGSFHTCAILDTGQVRCWGYGVDGELGYGNTDHIGNDETPGSVGPVDLGAGRTAVAIAAGSAHTCAILDTGQVRCWGRGDSGQLGYGNTDDIGDNESPGAFGPVDLGGLIATSLEPDLTLKARPKRDRREPFRFKVSGEVSGPFIVDDAVCSGQVVLKTKPKITRKKTVDLEREGLDCLYRAKLKATKEGKAKVIAKFKGNGSLDPTMVKKRVTAG